MRARRPAAVGAALFLLTCLIPRYGLGARGLDTSLFKLWSDQILDGRVPYRDFGVDYPPGALPAFVVPGWLPGEYEFWFKAFQAACGAVLVVAVSIALERLGANRRRLWLGTLFAALAPLALGPIVLVRFDLWPTALVAVGLAAILSRRNEVGFAALALGTAAKLFPVVLVPLVALYLLRRDGREAAWRALAWFGGVFAAVVLPFALLAPGALLDSVLQQAGRELQIESLGGAALLVAHELGGYTPQVTFGSGSWNVTGPLPRAVGLGQTVVDLVVVAAVWGAFARGRRRDADLVLASAAAITAFAVFGRVLSPQYLIWLVPLVALLGRRMLAAGALLVAAMLLTRQVYPARYDALVTLHATPIWLLAVRSAVLLTLAGVLLVQIGIASRRT